MHRLWKDRFVKRVTPRRGEEILDMAGGTGDVAFRMAKRGAHVTVADDEESYRSLVESIRRFPRPTAFKAMVAEAGFVRPAAEPMLGGLVTIHSGWKI
jgi:ubiquinone/menaquinone biosynthesis C-methylase UbiE